MNYIDILIICIVALFALLGYRRGLVKTIFSVAAVFVAVIITSMCLTPFTAYMETTKYSDIIKTYVYEAFVPDTEGKGATEEEKVDDIAASYADTFGLPDFIEKNIIEKGTELINETKVSAQKAVAESTAQMVFNAVCAVLLYILVLIFMHMIKSILLIIAKLPVIKSINKLAGGVIGAANGVLIVYIALGIVMFFVSMGNIASVAEDIGASQIGSYMYDNNIVFNFIFR